MKAPINNDNIYTVGTVIYARQNPAIKLVIKSYKARIYYCEVTDSDRKTTKAYYEHELLAPISKPHNSSEGFMRLTDM
jgi:hypothetical protein